MLKHVFAGIALAAMLEQIRFNHDHTLLQRNNFGIPAR